MKNNVLLKDARIKQSFSYMDLVTSQTHNQQDQFIHKLVLNIHKSSILLYSARDVYKMCPQNTEEII